MVVILWDYSSGSNCQQMRAEPSAHRTTGGWIEGYYNKCQYSESNLLLGRRRHLSVGGCGNADLTPPRVRGACPHLEIRARRWRCHSHSCIVNSWPAMLSRQIHPPEAATVLKCSGLSKKPKEDGSSGGPFCLPRRNFPANQNEKPNTTQALDTSVRCRRAQATAFP